MMLIPAIGLDFACLRIGHRYCVFDVGQGATEEPVMTVSMIRVKIECLGKEHGHGALFDIQLSSIAQKQPQALEYAPKWTR